MAVSKLVIVGSGTAGLTNALITKTLFKNLDVVVVSSETIGIIGVGEGSTEHWTQFEKTVGIERSVMVAETEATFKMGIRFVDWTNQTPDYFHSIAGGQDLHGTFLGLYNYVHSQKKQLTPNFVNSLLAKNFVLDTENILFQTNQFHFDTFKLNKFLKSKCLELGVKFVEGEVSDLKRNNATGDITELVLADGSTQTCDFVVDASGFQRAVISRLGNIDWQSYKDYLPTDSALVFQTEEDLDGGIKPYTLATAMDAGWMWEIPTQTRRGNGYVFSSDYISDDQALDEIERVTSRKLENQTRIIRFESGYVRNSWLHNCVAIGLSSGFVEPLEATSIAASINQSLALSSYIAVYEPGREPIRKAYLRVIDSMMENLLSMICMHYVSDRDDTQMWRDQKERPLPEMLSDFIEIWSYRGPESHDMARFGFELFSEPHFWHVAQGQNLIALEGPVQNLNLRNTSSTLQDIMSKNGRARSQQNFIPHKEALNKGMNFGT